MPSANGTQVKLDGILADALEQYHEEGYAVLPKQYTTEQLESWKKLYDRIAAERQDPDGNGPTWFGNMAEIAPDEMLPGVANPAVLTFLEAVMGPFVQLDNLTLAVFPPAKDVPPDAVSGWHRDRWAGLPRGDAFQRPLAANAVCYLQDLDDELGPLRVVPGSHRKPITLSAEETTKARPDERLIYAKADDVVITHNGLIHSGTPNRSDRPRYFFSIYYNMTWLRTTDDHSGPNVTRLISEARARNDHRVLRLFGVDDNLQRRGNSGFLRPDEERWAEWAAEDQAALADSSAA